MSQKKWELNYKVIIQSPAKKDLKKLPKKEATIIIKKILSVCENPLNSIERLKGRNLWKLRIGNYRAIIYLNTKDKELRILKIGHRKEIYKKLQS
ncbi:type II toxin-antitoxin system mRNA interferase toxin, RelE/StbE family [Candidatus Woesearchaeota archaeon]|nr:type II toxin-antitoxin system mRNA interferase toxin, RelE/StbE family [Candidatus Woesearchaeota archaeon]|tara:strand:- start:5082 stop:5366 length:285 start_codon:yes stop_codon:yes gene_type:complete